MDSYVNERIESYLETDVRSFFDKIDEESNVDLHFPFTDTEDDEEEIVYYDETPDYEIKAIILEELKAPEYERKTLYFRDEKTGETVEGIPMAELKGDAFLFKVEERYKKYKVENISLLDPEKIENLDEEEGYNEFIENVATIIRNETSDYEKYLEENDWEGSLEEFLKDNEIDWGLYNHYIKDRSPEIAAEELIQDIRDF
jgi:hypothetical protein